MSRIKYFAVLFLVFNTWASAQKIGVVDTNYILEKLPQYKEAESRLNSQIAAWQSEIQNMQIDLDKKNAAFENEKVLLVGDQLKERQKEIDDLSKKVKMMLNSRFGTMGEINSSRSNLTKPFQDQIWNAIKTVSEKNSLGIVLDKSDNISVIYLEKRYDYTDKVLDLLIKNQPQTNSKSNPVQRGSSVNEGKGARQIAPSKAKRGADKEVTEINQ
ncbi:OmpH family outer membrane protein [Halpernia frigidisoli]|uniref:Periplasmic chaperone for outer membrane proteins Skp n=1 Tax=Halpernia frigidisoli TaxID=1125876 RepID=A0A1I3I7V9_9FLAO|nr:OmpH family outer membrane protein [Halpernia frigidisoli]SFI43833.1 periplasmic chaperone for outer membrane proteins Skp [Halpernia frigidisoli]